MPKAYAKNPDTGDLFPVNSIHVKTSKTSSVWGRVQEIVRSGNKDRLLAAGDILTAQWTNPKTKAVYDVPWRCIAVDSLVENLDGELQPAAIFQQLFYLNNPAFKNPFDPWEAFFVVKDKAVEPGRYYVSSELGTTSNPALDVHELNFTLTKQVPIGGLITGFHDAVNTLAEDMTVETYAKQTDTEPLETVQVSAGAVGVKLVDLTVAGSSESNSEVYARFGSPRWQDSWIRQWLNSFGLNWWVPKNKYDLQPAQLKNREGFMTGWGSDFLSVIQPFKSQTVYTDPNGTTVLDETIDKFVLPSLESMYIEAYAEGEGASHPDGAYPFWKAAIGTPTPLQQSSSSDALIGSDIQHNACGAYLWTRSMSENGVAGYCEDVILRYPTAPAGIPYSMMGAYMCPIVAIY